MVKATAKPKKRTINISDNEINSDWIKKLSGAGDEQKGWEVFLSLLEKPQRTDEEKKPEK